MIIVVEGLDNTGKSTVIQTLQDQFDESEVIHCSKPEDGTVEEQASKQDYFFNTIADYCKARPEKTFINTIADYCKVRPEKTFIFDRAWYGEYVYGQLYRGRKGEDVVEMIHKVENKFSDDDIFFILLDVNDPDFCVKNDDGLSISEADIDKIRTEKHLFEEIFGLSKLHNKKIVYVDRDMSFRSRESIMEDIYDLIKRN